MDIKGTVIFSGRENRINAGRPTVASCKVPADVIEKIDFHAIRNLLPRSTWIRNAIMEKLKRDAHQLPADNEYVADACEGSF